MKLGMPPMDESIMFNSVDEAMEAKIAERSAPDSCMWMAPNSLYDDLSEQHLMDCANGHFSYDDEGSWGAFGCDGAWPQAYYDWVIKQNDGRLEKEDCAPYQAKDRTCVDDDSRCCDADSDPNCIWTLNHEVTVIGYGHES